VKVFGNKLKNFGKSAKQFFKEFYTELTYDSPYGIVSTVDRMNTFCTKKDRDILSGKDKYKTKGQKGSD